MRRLIACLAAVLLVLVPGLARADDPPIDLEAVEAWLAEAGPQVLDRAEYSEITLSVVSGGELVVASGEDQVFRIGSITKLFNALAVVQLAERGELDLDADVGSYLDFELDLPEGEVTLRHLLSHTAGFEESIAELFHGDPGSVRSLEEWLRSDQPAQAYAPGTVTAYSNYSASLAGLIVEEVSGQSWEDYVETQILDPLGMDSTSARQPLPDDLAARLAPAYPGGGEEPLEFEYLADTPAGVMTSDAADMATFAQFLLEGAPEVLGDDARERWLGAQPMEGMGALAGAGYMALGMAHGLDGAERSIGHAGDTIAYHSSLLVWPEHDTAIFVGTTDSPAAAALAADFGRHFFDAGHSSSPTGDAAAQAEAVADAGGFTSARTNGSAAVTLTSPTAEFTVVDETGLDLLGQEFEWRGDWLWASPRTGELLAARVSDGEVDAVQIGPYSTWVQGGLPTIPVGIAAVIAMLGLVLAGATAGVSWIVARARGAEKQRGWAALSRHLAGWAPVVFVGALGLKVWALWPYVQVFVFPGPEIPPLRAHPVLEVAGNVAMAAALACVVAMGAQVVVNARSRRVVRAVAWTLALLCGATLAWALGETRLLFSPLVL